MATKTLRKEHASPPAKNVFMFKQFLLLVIVIIFSSFYFFDQKTTYFKYIPIL